MRTMRTLATLGISLLLLASLSTPVLAGVEPSPWRPQIHQLDSVVAELGKITSHLDTVLQEPPEPGHGDIGKLGAMANQLGVLNNRVSAVLTQPPEPNMPPEVIESLGSVRDAAWGIVGMVNGTPGAQQPPDPNRDALARVGDAAQSIVDQMDEAFGTPGY